MRLCLSLPELEQGQVVVGGTKDRITNLRHLAMGRQPVACTPIMTHDQTRVAVVLLTQDAEGTNTSAVRLYFRPVWCRTFTVCSMRKHTLSALLCEFASGKKYWIDRDGVKETNQITTNGNGCDPSDVGQSELVLGDMLDKEKRGDILLNTISFIQRTF